jgi:hypothetical protein
MLLTTFAGRTVAMLDIYEQHHIGRRFIKKNYKDVLLQMETRGLIRCEPAKRRLGTFGDGVKVTFPVIGVHIGKVKH